MKGSKGWISAAVALLIGGAICLIIGISMNGRVLWGQLQGGGYGYGYWNGWEEIIPGIFMLAGGAAILIVRYILGNKAQNDAQKADDIQKREQVQGAAQGDARSLFLLGNRYYNGNGVAKDISAAVSNWQQAVGLGHAGAMYSLGRLFENGEGVNKDEKRALELYEGAEAKGNKSAAVKVGEFYRDGKGGVSKNEAEAFKRFEGAAKEGSGVGCYNLGLAYLEGMGCNRDVVLAKNYINRAAQADVPEAKETLKRVMNLSDEGSLANVNKHEASTSVNETMNQTASLNNDVQGSEQVGEEKTVLLNVQKVALVRVSSGEEIVLSGESFTLGRSKSKCDYVIDNKEVSGAHASVTQKDGKVFVSDLDSSNHTYVNGTRIDSTPVQLADGDTIRLAKEEFRVVIKG